MPKIHRITATSTVAKSVLPKARTRTCRCGEKFSIKNDQSFICGLGFTKRCRRNRQFAVTFANTGSGSIILKLDLTIRL